jgi:uncharacterized damage-inducible protein DinB
MGDLWAPAQLIEMMEGNRRLTLRTIRAFPEHALFHYSPVESMRTFAKMVWEIIAVEERAMRGIVTGDWTDYPELYTAITTSEGLLEACESVRRRTLDLWPELTVDKLLTVEAVPNWGTESHVDRLRVDVENEVHHRAQGFVYLRLLGIEPPFFWDR